VLNQPLDVLELAERSLPPPRPAQCLAGYVHSPDRSEHSHQRAAPAVSADDKHEGDLGCRGPVSREGRYMTD
jgi:hypothetical protein